MEAVTVMLVDDDLLAIQYLEGLLDWEGLGYRIVVKAYNGKQALKQFQAHRPQIVITDISMPLMNGIELLGELKRIDADVGAILLTSYSEFEYARAAIGKGADAFLIKDELNEGIALRTLDEVRRRVARQRGISSTVREKAVLDYLTLGEDYLRGRHGDAQADLLLNRRFQVVMVQKDLPFKPGHNEFAKELSVSPFEVLDSCLAEKGKEIGALTHLIMPDNRVLFLLQVNGGSAWLGMEALCRRWLSLLVADLGPAFTVFCCRQPVTLCQLRKFCELPTRKLSFIRGVGGVYDLATTTYEHGADRPDTEITDVEQLLDAGDADGFEAFVRIQIEGAQNFETIAHTIDHLARVVRSRLKFYPDLRGHEVHALLSEWLYDRVQALRWARQLFMAALDYRRRARGQNIQAEVRKALEYIHRHYRESDLKIDRIAREVGLSESRLSVLFKASVQKTINQYITGLRLEKAKELLASGQYKVYEVAEGVGYPNQAYFSHMFFKVTGTTPNQYRKD